MAIKNLVLYSYYQSSASWRIRALLALKNIPHKYEAIHLLDGVQHSKNFLDEVNPMHQVPAIKFSDLDGKTHVLNQSLPIIQFLEEQFPDGPSVLPKDPIARAKSLAIADTISGGIQPLQNLETLTKYHEPVGIEPLTLEQRKKVAQYWISKKLENLERLVQKTAGKYCVGDDVSIADLALVPQMFNARRFEIDTSKFPTLKAIDERLQQLELFKASHPSVCPDAPKQSQ